MNDVLGGKRTAPQVEAAQPDTLKRHIASKWILERDPSLSDKCIARLVGYADGNAVAAHRKELEAQGRITHTEERYALIKSERVYGPRQELPEVEIITNGHDLTVAEDFSRALVTQTEPSNYINPAVKLLAEKQTAGKAKGTVKAYETYSNKWARLMGYSSLRECPWWAITDAGHVLMLLEKLRQDPKVNTNSYPGYFAVLIDIVEDNYFQGLIEPLEWERIKKLDRPGIDESQIKRNPPIDWETWLKVHQAFEYRNEEDWMLSAALCLIYPNGLRPSDCLGILRSDLVTLDDEIPYIEFRRRKTKKRYGLMLDHLPAVVEVLKKWNSLIPDGQKHLWYERRGGMQWNKPIGMDSTSNVLRAGMARHMRRALDDKGVVPQSGRVSYKTHATGWVSDMYININGGWKAEGQGASVKYFRQHQEKMKGVFAKVPEFYKFNDGLETHIYPHLDENRQAELFANAPEALRFCQCECGAVIPREADPRKRYIDAAHKMRHRRATGKA